MKRLIVLPIFLFLAVNFANAQMKSPDEEEIVREIWGMALQDLTASTLSLNQEEADKFWPIWKEYRAARKEIVNTKLRCIADYAHNYDHMTNDKAAEITTILLDNDKKLIGIKSKYFKKIKKSLSAIKAAQFIQIETTIDNELRAFITENLPLVPDPKKK